MSLVRSGGAPTPFRGRCSVPGDKAISHRAALLAMLAPGRSCISGFSPAGDCQATLGAVGRVGVTAVLVEDRLEVVGGLPQNHRLASVEVDCGRSGTTMRMLAGILAGRMGEAVLSGDPQLLKRPMARVAGPLRLMGAQVTLGPGGMPPIGIQGARLHGIVHHPEVASAQVKSAILLAALGADGPTAVVERVATRDHTERLLRMMGAAVSRHPGDLGSEVRLEPGRLRPLRLQVPGDASSAAVVLAAAALVPGSDVVIEGSCINPTRTGLLRVLGRMGAALEVYGPDGADEGEPSADIRIRHRPLRAATVSADEVPSLIDELPLLGLLATQAEGVTAVRGAGELRVKESDRIRGLVNGLRALGAEAEEMSDGFWVRGPCILRGATCDAMSDHRLAMTFSLAGFISTDPVNVLGMAYVDDSFPGFVECLRGLQ